MRHDILQARHSQFETQNFSLTYSIFCIGKTAAGYIAEGCDEYSRRLRHYGTVVWKTLPDVKNGASLPQDVLCGREGELFMRELVDSDVVVLLDAAGRQYTSPGFARFVQKFANAGARRLCFLIGGAYGFSPAVEARADERLSLSPMTFPHDLVRLVFSEQLYRAMTILRGEQYHHE